MPETSPTILLIGQVTEDLIDGHRVPGGSVSYAARTASAIGKRLRIVTSGAHDANLDPLDGHDVAFVQAPATLTFALSAHDDGPRRLRVLARPGRAITAADVPAAWHRTDVLILAPLLPGDLDLQSLMSLHTVEHRAVLAQGLQRRLHGTSSVVHHSHPSPELLRCCTPDCTVFLSSDETDPWAVADLDAVISRAGRLVITRGRAGADIYRGGRTMHVDARPATALDTTGAGDVFAVALILALGEGEEAAASLASAYAAASVETAGPLPLPGRAEVERRPGEFPGVRRR